MVPEPAAPAAVLPSQGLVVVGAETKVVWLFLWERSESQETRFRIRFPRERERDRHRRTGRQTDRREELVWGYPILLLVVILGTVSPTVSPTGGDIYPLLLLVVIRYHTS